MTIQDDKAAAACAVLGVAEDASEDELRAAYMRGLREYPPDRAPEQFQRLREAYDYLRDPEIRFKSMLRGDDPEQRLADWLDVHPAPRKYPGPGPWLAAMRKRKTK